VREKDPRQLKFQFALWTRDLIAKAVRQKFGVRLSVTSLGRLLHQLGLSCQKPLYRGYQQDPDIVRQWNEKVFPTIKKEAKKVGATICFEDESGIRSDFHSGRMWAPKGKTPVIEGTSAYFGLNMVAAISTRGYIRFMVVDGSVRADQICEFLRRLMHDSNRPIFLTWDGHPTRRSRKVKECIESFDGRLKVFFLPFYASELNPAEQVWNNVKFPELDENLYSDSLVSG